jgi:hypothetical protein
LDGRIEDEKVAAALMERFGYGPTHLFRYEIKFRHALESRDAFPTRMREIRLTRGETGLDLWCASWANNRVSIIVFLIIFLMINLVDRFNGPWGSFALIPALIFSSLALVRARQSKSIQS